MKDQAAGSPKSRARAKTERMRAEQAAQAARQKRNQRIATGVGAVVIVGLLVAIVLAVLNATGGDGDDQADGKVVVPTSAVDGAIPVGDAAAPVTVDLYFDYMCPACAAFEQGNGEDLGRLIDEGTAKVNLRVMNFLDERSGGTEYSTRAGNALATVSDEAPEAVWDFHNALYANLPAEGGSGLSDDEIAEIAVDAGVPEEVTESFEDGTYRGWVSESNQAAGDAGVQSTPTIMIDGEPFEGDWAQPGAVADAIEAAAESE